MKDVLTEIQDGTFARNWIAEHQAGLPNYKRHKQADLEHPIEEVGKRLRSGMKWLDAAPKPSPANNPEPAAPAAHAARPQEEAA